jgi:hypothetical protein
LANQIGHFVENQLARSNEGDKLSLSALVFDEGVAVRGDRGGGHRQHVVGLERRMGNATDMPQLAEQKSVLLMHRVGDLSPCADLLDTVNAGSPGITLGLHRYLRRFAHDQGC